MMRSLWLFTCCSLQNFLEMCVLMKLTTIFCMAIFAQTVTNSYHDTCPTSTATSELTCSVFPRQLPKCQCDCNNGDCDSHQKSLTSCGNVVFYGEQKNMHFSSDDKFFEARCKDQLDCAESIQCFVTCCLQARGAELMKRMMRGAQFELLQLCHPDADPTTQEQFKDLTDCMNAIWPTINICVTDFDWKISAGVTKGRIDIPRFSCAFHDFSHCVYTASNVECCNAGHRAYFKNVIQKYTGDGYRLMCSDNKYSHDSAPCNCLPPVDRTGADPPSVLEGLLTFARALNSSN